MKWMVNDLTTGSLITSVLGLVLLIFPKLTNKLIVLGIGLVLLCYGIYRIVRYMTAGLRAFSEYDLSYGLIAAAGGVIMLIYSAVVISILPFLFGLLLIVGGAVSVQTAFDMKRFGRENWIMHLIFGIAFLIVGAVSIRNPFKAAEVLTRFVGGSLLVEGLYLTSVSVSKDEMRRSGAYRSGRFGGLDPEDPNIIDEEDVKARGE